MNVSDQLINYVEKKFSHENINDILMRNNLFYIMEYYSKYTDSKTKDILLLNKICQKQHFLILEKILPLFKENNIRHIFFKGTVLSQLLYHDPFKRTSADIDFYVFKEDFDNAYNILLEHGFMLINEVYLNSQHHISLTNGLIIIELHKNLLNPLTQIQESYMLTNTNEITINNHFINTFSITATLLHLLYHLYMDTYMLDDKLYYILSQKQFPKTFRFLYRAYEIALFTEKYFNKILWKDIENDIKKQKLQNIFKKVIFDILEIFPEAFPKSFIHTVLQLNYIKYENDKFYLSLIEAEINEKKIDRILSEYIDDNWEKQNNIHGKIGVSFTLTKKINVNDLQKELNCNIYTQKIHHGLKLSFEVSNNDFCFSPINNYDTQSSDGVHLLLCGTKKYSYNSIFLFPKKINGKIEIVPCNVLNNANIVLDEKFVKAKFTKTNEGYIISVIFSNEFIKSNQLDSHFYMGLVISDCSSKTNHRENQLTLTEESEWFNPIHFAKIYIE